MSDRTLNQLPEETIKLIASTQIITSVSTAVKELIENSLDAESKNIQVKLDNYGFDILEVKDDGHGISYNNVQRMFLPGYTSKISCFNDLGRLQTYGFRGEALSALAKLSNITLTTKTNADTLAMTYVINKDGIPQSSKPSHLSKGTIVSVANIFGNLPVRKQYLSNKKKVAEELKKVEYVVQSLSAIHPELRISLIHNKCSIWQKNSVKGIKQSLMQVVGLKIVAKLEHLNELASNILVDLMIPKKNLENIDSIFSSTNQNVFLYVNKRPVILSKICKVVMEHILLQYADHNPTGRYAVCLISIEVPPQEIDVNLEPNKTKVYLKNETDVVNLLDHMLSTYYEQNISRPEPDREETKTDVEDGEEITDDEIQQRKRPRIGPSPEEVGNMRNQEFAEKNEGWHLEVIPVDDLTKQENAEFNLCSQINKENCTLATKEEVGELKKLLNENSQKLVTSVNLDLEARQDDRNEVQNYDKLKKSIERLEVPNVVVEEPVPTVEKPILPSWPIRDIPKPKHSEVNNENKTIEKENQKSQDDLLDGSVLDNIDVKDWSKGKVNLEDCILPSGVLLAKPTVCAEEVSDVFDDDLEKFDLSVRSVSSQMGKKELSGFTKFARIMRPKIIQEFPGIVFTEVAGLLAERWTALPRDDKSYYEKLSKEVDLRREIHRENKTLYDYNIVQQPSNENAEAAKKKKRKESGKRPERRELKISASLNIVINKRENIWKDERESEVQPIGQLQPSGNWIYKKGNEIGHVRHYGLHELILSQKMLASHSVPRRKAPQEILINETLLGKELWDVLMRMETEYDPVNSRHTITNPVISKNGFKIDLEKGENGFATGWITEVASMIPFYGIGELKETLQLYLSQGEFSDLSSLRTTAVINFIASEAIRIVRQTPRPPDLADIKEWIETWQMGLQHLTPQCLHSREIFVPLYHIQS